jgi:hypothetical protein
VVLRTPHELHLRAGGDTLVLRVHVGTHSFGLSKGSQFVLEENTVSEYTLVLIPLACPKARSLFLIFAAPIMVFPGVS